MDVQTGAPVARQGAEREQLREKSKDAPASTWYSLCRDVFVSVQAMSTPMNTESPPVLASWLLS